MVNPEKAVEIFRFTAAEAKKSIVADYIGKSYPFIQSKTDSNLNRFYNSKFNFCSFDVEGDSDLIRELLMKSLIKASDRYDSAFCWHAYKKHPSFIPAVVMLQQSIAEGEAEIKLNLEKVDINQKVVPDSGYLVETSWAESGRQVVKAKAVFLDVPTVAFELLRENPILKDQGVYKFISQKYSNYSTSRVKTAYLQRRIA